MKIRLLLLSILTLTFIVSCEEDDSALNGTGKVGFTLSELVEIENATSGLTINVGINDYNHAGGTISVSITGADYGSAYETSEGSADFVLDVAPQALVTTFSINPVDDDVIQDDKVLTITLTSTTGALEIGEIQH